MSAASIMDRLNLLAADLQDLQQRLEWNVQVLRDIILEVQELAANGQPEVPEVQPSEPAEPILDNLG